MFWEENQSQMKHIALIPEYGFYITRGSLVWVSSEGNKIWGPNIAGSLGGQGILHLSDLITIFAIIWIHLAKLMGKCYVL